MSVGAWSYGRAPDEVCARLPDDADPRKGPRSAGRFTGSATARMVGSFVLLLCALAVLAGCSAGPLGMSVVSTRPIKVGVIHQPGIDIVTHVETAVAPSIGLAIKPVRFPDADAAKRALRHRQIDAAFVPYDAGAEQQAPGSGAELVFFAPVVMRPLGLYSSRIDTPAQLNGAATSTGAEILIPDDPKLVGRALRLLERYAGIRLRAGADVSATLHDITDNPHHVRITPLPLDDLTQRYHEATAAILGPSALGGDRAAADRAKFAEHMVALEPVAAGPDVDGLYVRTADQADPTIRKLSELLRSPSVKGFIDKAYGTGLVPAF